MASPLAFEDWAYGHVGVTLKGQVIGDVTHPLVLAVPQQDAEVDDNGNIRQLLPYYRVALPLDAAVNIGDRTVLPVSATLQFNGEVSSIENDLLRNGKWLIVRGEVAAVS